MEQHRNTPRSHCAQQEFPALLVHPDGPEPERPKEAKPLPEHPQPPKQPSTPPPQEQEHSADTEPDMTIAGVYLPSLRNGDSYRLLAIDAPADMLSVTSIDNGELFFDFGNIEVSEIYNSDFIFPQSDSVWRKSVDSCAKEKTRSNLSKELKRKHRRLKAKIVFCRMSAATVELIVVNLDHIRKRCDHHSSAKGLGFVYAGAGRTH